MAIISDQELLSLLLQATNEQRLAWQRTSGQDQFAAQYANKWTLTVVKSDHPDDPFSSYWLALSNADGDEILRIHSSQEPILGELFELARRRALKVDEALNDLLKEIAPEKSGNGEIEISDEDIPF